MNTIARVAILAVSGAAIWLLGGTVEWITETALVFLAIEAVAATGLVLIMGLGGQVSIGHAAFYGIGAYSTAIAAARWGLGPIVSVIIGVAIAGVVGALLGRIVFRLSGHILAMATLAFGLIFNALARRFSFTGGNGGLTGVPRLELFGWEADTRVDYFAATWVVLIVVVMISYNISKSAMGRALVATGTDETAAACSGINIVRAKVAVFATGAMVAAVAGSMYAHFVRFVDPTAFDLLESVRLLVVVTVGGIALSHGAVVGAAVLVLLDQASREIIPRLIEGATGPVELVVFGFVVVVTLLFLPQGVGGSIGDVIKNLLPDRDRPVHEIPT